jgi:hypothetical protein
MPPDLLSSFAAVEAHTLTIDFFLLLIDFPYFASPSLILINLPWVSSV